MSSFGDMGGGDYSALSNVGSGISSLGDTGNSYGFTTGLGNVDSGAGFDTLNGGLMGAGAGTVPNGFIDGSSNYTPGDTTSGISLGALNGDTTSGGITSGFSMPGGMGTGSMAQMASQALGLGSKLAQPSSSQARAVGGGGGKIRIPQVSFTNPIVDFAGSNGGSQAGNSLLTLLAKYHPGAQ